MTMQRQYFQDTRNSNTVLLTESVSYTLQQFYIDYLSMLDQEIV